MTDKKIPLTELTRQLSAAEWTRRPPEGVSGVRIDSRRCSGGELFVALQGENTHGHDFVDAARNNGAAAAMVEAEQPARLPQLVVPATLEALQELARLYRKELDDHVVGVTGSCGKTTVKEMLAELLKAEFELGKTQGNYNNHIGLPLTVLNQGGAEVLVAEVAMNKKGEIEKLAGVLSPETGVITHVGPAHLAGVNTVEELAREKADLLRALPPKGTAVVPGWVREKELLVEASRPDAIVAGEGRDADVEVGWSRGEDKSKIKLGRNEFELYLNREEMLRDAALAAVVARELGLGQSALREGLKRLGPVRGRGREHRVNGAVLIDGSYNANPDSMRGALRRLAELPAPRLAVLGSMKELGSRSSKAHRQLGRAISEVDDLEVHFVGEGKNDVAAGVTSDTDLQLHDSVEELFDFEVEGYGGILVKASNAVGLGKLVERWRDS